MADLKRGGKKKNDEDLIYQTLERCERKGARRKSAQTLEKSEPQSLRASERFRLQLKDRDTKRDNRAIVTRDTGSRR